MPLDEDGFEPRGRPHALHYYGDTARILFVIIAVLIFVAETTGAALPLSPVAAIAAAVVLAVAAGVTNPEQQWIHWANELIAIFGVLVFGVDAVSRYRAGGSLANPSYLFAEAITLLFLLALYFATKTVRGYLLRPHLE